MAFVVDVYTYLKNVKQNVACTMLILYYIEFYIFSFQ